MAPITEGLVRSGEKASRFIARQPIFDASEIVYGYELLFRSGPENYYTGDDGDAAVRDVVDNLITTGTGSLTAGRKAFINCTRQFLVNEYATLLSKRDAVVEILETVEPDEHVLEACRKLKTAGYTLALDDFVYDEKFEPFIELADIIKVDFKVSPHADRESMVEEFAPRGIRMLAEKVETRGELEEAQKMGYCYFQGYFFCKPQIVESRQIPAFKLHYMQVLQAIHKPELNLAEVEKAIQGEVSLCHKLLKFVNSPLFGFRCEIISPRHALALLGDDEVKKWVSVAAVLGIAGTNPTELVMMSLTRAKCCELLASKIESWNLRPGIFLMGMFSLMDVMLGRPMGELVAEMALPGQVRAALLGSNNRQRDVLDLIRAYESANWSEVDSCAARLKLSESRVSRAYVESVDWAQRVFQV